VYLATRIFELARELGVTSKVVLTKCRAEELEVKNHMATVSAGLEATIREWFSDEGAQHTAVETTEHVDLKTARSEAKKVRRRKKKDDEPTSDAPTESTDTGDAPDAEPSETPEAPAEEAPTEEATEVVAAVEEPVVEDAPTEVAPVEPVAETPEPEAQVEPETDAPEPEEPQGETPEVAAEVAPEAPAAPETKKPDAVVPAGPQVVPAPAQVRGPRVIRVEAPEPESTRRRPAPRHRPAAAAGGTGAGAPAAGAGTGTGRFKKGKKGGKGGDDDKGRSPRRKGGGTGAGGTGGGRQWRGTDLKERSERLAAASGGMRRHRASTGGRRGEAVNAGKTGKVEIEEPITVKSLSAATGIKTAMIIKKLMTLGTMATINQSLSAELAETAVIDYGVELVVKMAETGEDVMLKEFESREKGDQDSRAPVVTFLGHVDHGKTSLLDHIRKATVADGEAGGITQHTGAYRVDMGDSHVVFLDTPGHEAFTAMRARGANMTDVVVLVVAADDGVMPQTVEAISHAKAAEVPIVVALNKIDMPNANIQRVYGQLAEHELAPQEWGGNTEVILTSAMTGEGIDTLVETLSLEAELLELNAETDAPATGFVVESEMSQGRGVVATLLVLDGTLNVGDVILAGHGYGRVRQMVDSTGKPITTAPPSTPVEVSGLDEIPEAGDRFYIVESIDKARQVAQERRSHAREKTLAAGSQVTLENLFSKIEDGQVTEVNLIIKADVQGSIEALTGTLEKLNTDEVRLNVILSGVGGVSTGDVTLAEASNAIIIGFHVVAAASARSMAETKGVDIRTYRVIYDIVEDMRKVLEEGLAPEIREESLGRATVRQVFKVSRVGSIAGCMVTDGKAVRNAKVRIIRDNVVMEDERTLDSLKRFKDDAREVRSGMECGLKIAGYDDIKEGDELEFYQRIEIERKL
jgi:translation initiation factor IF-2